jgi:hypothetical protein
MINKFAQYSTAGVQVRPGVFSVATGDQGQTMLWKTWGHWEKVFHSGPAVSAAI